MKFGIFLSSIVLALSIVGNSAGQTALSSTVPASQRASTERVVLPAPSGHFRVGRASFYRTDSSRPETYTADPADHRQVLFHIWYPAQPTGGTLAPYLDALSDDAVFRNAYTFVGFEKAMNTRSHAYTGVRISSAEKRYPVIVFSHGLGRVSAHYTTFLENLASHGYIVVGVDSPFFSSIVKMPDGRVIRNESQRNQRPGAREEEAVIQAQDLVFVLNELVRFKKDEIGLAGRFDLRRIGVFGHSRGGFTAPHACLLDSRFGACLNLDGYGLTPAVMEQGIRQPYMHIEEIEPWEPPATDEELSRANQTREEERRQVQDAKRRRETTFSKMSSGMYLVTVKGAVHNSFSDMPFIDPERWSGIEINAERALAITNAYILAFFDRYLRGRQHSLLSDPAPKSYPEVTLKIYRPTTHKKQGGQ